MSAPRIFASDIPPNVPEGWREAANWHIERTRDPGMVARLRRIIADARMVRFWEAADAAEFAPMRTRMLAVLVAGAYAPSENPGEIMERRRKLAERVRTLAEIIATDPDARHIDVEEVLHWTCPTADPAPFDAADNEPDGDTLPTYPRHGPCRKFENEIGSFADRPILVTNEARRSGMPPSFAKALAALAARLESPKPVWSFDPLRRASWVGTRELDAERRLVRALATETEHIRDEIGFDLIALAANVAIEGSKITASKARAIWRDFLRRDQPK